MYAALVVAHTYCSLARPPCRVGSARLLSRPAALS